MSETESRIAKAKMPVAFEMTMLIAQEPWFQDAMTKAEQAVDVLEKHDVVGTLALSNGSLQVGLLISLKEQKKLEEATSVSDWMRRDSVDMLRRGATSPFDSSDAFRKGRAPTVPDPAIDWAHAAARGVMELLATDKRLSFELGKLRYEHRRDLVQRATAIVRQADAWRRTGEE
jgi:hypothetical protein